MKKNADAQIHLREVKRDEMASIFPLVQMSYPSMTEALFNARLADMLPMGYHALAAFDGNEMVAVSGFWLRARFWCGRQIDIDNFFVHPDYRRDGLGTRMVAWLEERALAENCDLMVLDAYADGFLAHRFYHREGFVTTGYHFTKIPGSNTPWGKK